MKATIGAIAVAIVIIGGAILLVGSESTTTNNEPANNVSIVDGTQIIAIDVKGGYKPRKSVATSGLPTVIQFITNGTYDCSIAVRIPSLSIAKNLPPVGSTRIDIGTPKIGTLRGVCAMGMYSFEIEFGA